MPPSTPQVVVVGSFNQDHVWRSERFPQPGETRLGRFSSGAGGKGFNQAVACVRQGAATAFIGALGCDGLGDAAAALAQAEGLQAHWQRIPDEATGSAAILLDGRGQNLIVVGPGANAALSPEHISAQAEVITAARALLTQHEVNPAATLEAMRLARAAGVLTVHNPAPVLEPALCAPLLRLTDVLTPNESEFAALLGQRGVRVDPERLAALSDDALHALCRQLGVPTVVLTLGAGGAFLSLAEAGQQGDSPAFVRQPAEAAKVVDTTGAGDAFNGGLTAALAAGAVISDALRQAGRVATLAVEAAGAASAMPTAAMLRARFPDRGRSSYSGASTR